MRIKDLNKSFKSLNLKMSESSNSSSVSSASSSKSRIDDSDLLSSEECCSGEDLDPDPNSNINSSSITKFREVRFFTDTRTMREYYEHIKFMKKIEKNKLK